MSSSPVKPCVSTPVVDCDSFPDLPPPPWPEPDKALARQFGALELSDAVASDWPVISGSQQNPVVLSTTRSCPPRPSVPDAGEFPPPPTPQDLRDLLTPRAMPVPAHCQTALASPSVPVFLPQSEPMVHPGVPSFESVYLGTSRS